MVETIRSNGGSLADTAAYHGIPVALVQVAARYYAAYPRDIDEWIVVNEALFERERHLAAEQRRLLG